MNKILLIATTVILFGSQACFADYCDMCCSDEKDVLFCKSTTQEDTCTGGCGCCNLENGGIIYEVNKDTQDCCNGTPYKNGADTQDCCESGQGKTVISVAGTTVNGLQACCTTGQTAYWNGNTSQCCNGTPYKNGADTQDCCESSSGKTVVSVEGSTINGLQACCTKIDKCLKYDSNCACTACTDGYGVGNDGKTCDKKDLSVYDYPCWTQIYGYDEWYCDAGYHCAEDGKIGYCTGWGGEESCKCDPLPETEQLLEECLAACKLDSRCKTCQVDPDIIECWDDPDDLCRHWYFSYKEEGNYLFMRHYTYKVYKAIRYN